MIGKTLAHYEISALLGKGGMGEVYRARDTKLGREVALKVLPPSFARDAERVARFEREARTLASIQHPNIASIYGFEDAGDHRFLVMELVEGLDLAQRLRSGPLGVDEAIDVARQIAIGLEAAHDKGIVHRDLKPANVKRTADGQVKILDFGLARAYADEVSEQDLAHSPTITAGMTAQGTILGTAAYMSPEQARGKAIDKRTDLWAFGCVLYEMLTGDRFFEGETLPDSIGAILHKEIDLERLPAHTPPSVSQLVRRCLVKDPNRRMRDAGQARIELESAQEEMTQSGFGIVAPKSAAHPMRRASLVWVGIAAIAGIAMGWGVGASMQPSSPPAVVRKLDLGIRLNPLTDTAVDVAISPDGKRIAYVTEGRLWLQDLDQLGPRRLEGTEGAEAPFWSPNSDEIGYFRGNNLWKISITGVRPTQICSVAGNVTGGRGAWWDERDRIVFSLGSAGILAVSGRGGQPRELVACLANERDLHEPYVLPGDRGIVFAAHPTGASSHQLWLFADGERRLLFESDHRPERLGDPVYDPSGHLVLTRRRGNVTQGLWALPFSLRTLEVTGEMFLIAPNGSDPSLARDGTLAFINGYGDFQGSQQLAWYDRTGRRLSAIGGTRRDVTEMVISPDGSKIALNPSDPETREPDVVVIDLERGSETRLTHDASVELLLRWMPSSTELSFVQIVPEATTIGTMATRVVSIDGSSQPRILLERGGVGQVLRDGQRLVAMMPVGADSVPPTPGSTPFVIAVASGSGSARPEPISEPSRDTYFSEVSADEQWMLFETGDLERDTYLTRFPAMERRWRVSVNGGDRSFWDPRGDRIYYVRDWTLMQVSFEVVDGQPRLGRPEKLFEIPAHPPKPFSDRPGVRISPDGERFLVLDYLDQSDTESPSVKLVQNWVVEFGSR